MNPAHKKAFTLTELIIAVVLLGVIFMAATTFNIASFSFFRETDKFVQTQLDISPAMEKVVKEISLEAGDVASPGISFMCYPPACSPNNEVHIARDYNSSGIPNNTPNDYTDDTCVAFWRGDGLQIHDLMYCSNCSGCVRAGLDTHTCGCLTLTTLVSNRIVAPSDPSGKEGFTVAANPNCGVDITITGRFDPTQLPGDNNPQVELTTTACPRSVSLQ